jgi:hypothetical protein
VTAARLLVGAAVLVAATRVGDPEPSAALAPEAVVRIQVEAMGRNDDPAPDAGIATAFRFASPGNRAATGPLARFAAMVHGPAYRDLLDFERAAYGDLHVAGDRAAQRVTLTRADGREVRYVFTLSRQRGGAYDGCWMTDGVAPEAMPDARRLRRA